MSSNPKGPCTSTVYTWALKGFLYPCFGVYVCTTMVLGPFAHGENERGDPTRTFMELLRRGHGDSSTLFISLLGFSS